MLIDDQTALGWFLTPRWRNEEVKEERGFGIKRRSLMRSRWSISLWEKSGGEKGRLCTGGEWRGSPSPLTAGRWEPAPGWPCRGCHPSRAWDSLEPAPRAASPGLSLPQRCSHLHIHIVHVSHLSKIYWSWFLLICPVSRQLCCAPDSSSVLYIHTPPYTVSSNYYKSVLVADVLAAPQNRAVGH